MLDREELLAFTRPEITDGRILLTGSDGFDGYEIVEYLGMVWGISVRAKDMGQDCAMGCKQMTGGELQSYTELGDESRQRCIDRLLAMADRQGANGVINIGFDLTGARQGGSQVVAYGTAVVIRPVKNYVPTGAMGNIVYEIAESLTRPQER